MTSFAARRIPLLLAACAALIENALRHHLTHRTHRGTTHA